MTIAIPTNWSAREARAIYEFLEAINQEIFRLYKDRIEELCWTECWDEGDERQSLSDPDFNDEIPF